MGCIGSEQQGLLYTAYMWDIWVPSVMALPLLLPRVLSGVDLEDAPRRRALVR